MGTEGVRYMMNTIRMACLRLLHHDEGQDLVEYALIVAAVGLALITTVNQLSVAIVSLYSSITQGLTSIGATGQ
jgi:Flp pilus assembly pilin Flp